MFGDTSNFQMIALNTVSTPFFCVITFRLGTAVKDRERHHDNKETMCYIRIRTAGNPFTAGTTAIPEDQHVGLGNAGLQHGCRAKSQSALVVHPSRLFFGMGLLFIHRQVPDVHPPA